MECYLVLVSGIIDFSKQGTINLRFRTNFDGSITLVGLVCKLQYQFVRVNIIYKNFLPHLSLLFWMSGFKESVLQGADNPASLRALKSALDQNPTVYDFLEGKDRFTEEPMTYSIRFQAGKKPQGGRSEAQYYLKNFKRYWGYNESAITWVKANAPALLKELEKETEAANTKFGNMDPFTTIPMPGEPMAELHLPKVKFCNVCKNIQKVKLCSRCKSVYYCSADCQKKDWPTHKLNCKK